MCVCQRRESGKSIRKQSPSNVVLNKSIDKLNIWIGNFNSNAMPQRMVFDKNLWNIKQISCICWLNVLTKQIIEQNSMLECSRKTHIFISFRVPFMNMNISCMYLAWKKKLSRKTKWAKWKRLLAILSAHLPRFSSSFRLRFLYFHKTHNHFNKTELMTSSYSIYIYFSIRSLVEFKCLNLFSKYPFKKFCVSYVWCVYIFPKCLDSNEQKNEDTEINWKETYKRIYAHTLSALYAKEEEGEMYMCKYKIVWPLIFFSGNIN